MAAREPSIPTTTGRWMLAGSWTIPSERLRPVVLRVKRRLRLGHGSDPTPMVPHRNEKVTMHLLPDPTARICLLRWSFRDAKLHVNMR